MSREGLVFSGTAWIEHSGRASWRSVYNARQLRRGKAKGQYLVKYLARANTWRKTIVKDIKAR